MMMTSSARHILRAAERCGGKPEQIVPRIRRYVPQWRMVHIDVEVKLSKKSFFDVFEADASARGVSASFDLT